MSQPVGALPPHFLDDVIEAVCDSNDPRKIAQAIANCPEVLNAIKQGLKYSLPPGAVGASRAQEIRRLVQEAIAG
jgi:hypothetical protein